MKLVYYIAFLILTGFIMIPLQSDACGTKSEQINDSCHKQSESKIDKHTCGKKEQSKCCKHGEECDGTCSKPFCHCPTHHLNVTIPLSVKLTQQIVIVKKPIINYQNGCYLAVYRAIWIPPKIG